MNNGNMFKRKWFSDNDKAHIFIFIVIIVCAVILVRHQNYIASGIFLILDILILYRHFTLANEVFITSEMIQLGKENIMWADIDNVLFNVPLGRDFYEIYIVIYGKNNISKTIYPLYYANGIDLRILIENICIENHIKYDVKDRGRVFRLAHPEISRIHPINIVLPYVSLIVLPLIVIFLIFGMMLIISKL